MHSRSQLRQLCGAVLRNARRAAKWIKDAMKAVLPQSPAATHSALVRRDVDRAQWRRWFKANRHYQRQMTAMRRAGRWARPRQIGGLPRWCVR